ncbi:MAG: radical SAM protein [Elusimicrobiales bacterium]|nr:radical SAM protein [Elusimicrobiales bacterium]
MTLFDAGLVARLDKAYSQTNYAGLHTTYPPVYARGAAAQEAALSGTAPFDFPAWNACTLYLHFPFCSSKCSFCRQFSCAVGDRKHYAAYTDLLCRELALYSDRLAGSRVSGLYFGGGTPALFDFERVFAETARRFNLAAPYFFNMEATPCSLDLDKLRAMKRIGVTRLCVGLQSMSPAVLKAINRPAAQLKAFPEVYGQALRAGLDNICVELVCGLPEETADSFRQGLSALIAMRPAGIHIYKFSQIPSTPLFRKYGPQTESQLLATQAMYKEGAALLDSAGYRYYGDDFSRDSGQRNPMIHRQAEYAGFNSVIGAGLGALGSLRLKSGVLKTSNTRSMRDYAAALSGGRLPAERAAFLENGDDLIRAQLVHQALFGRLTRADMRGLLPAGDKDLKGLYGRFSREFGFLQKEGKIKIAADFSEMTWDPSDLPWFRIFYSPAVLERCEAAIERPTFPGDFQTICRLRDGDFLPAGPGG